MARERVTRRPHGAAHKPRTEPATKSSGQPVPSRIASTLGPAFGHSFADVRIFNDDDAHAHTEAAHASALTVGQAVFFAHDAYEPDTPGGLHRLAHELAHTAQQRDATELDTGGAPLPILANNDPLESEARAAADAALTGEPVAITGTSGTPAASREPAEDKETEAMKAAILAGQFPWLRGLAPNYATTISNNGLVAKKTDGMTTSSVTADASLANGGKVSLGSQRTTEVDKNTSMQSSLAGGYSDGAAWIQRMTGGRYLADDGTQVADSNENRVAFGPDMIAFNNRRSQTRDLVTIDTDTDIKYKDGDFDAAYNRNRDFKLNENEYLRSGYGVQVGTGGAALNYGSGSSVVDTDTGIAHRADNHTTIAWDPEKGPVFKVARGEGTKVGNEDFQTNQGVSISGGGLVLSRDQSHTIGEGDEKKTATSGTSLAVADGSMTGGWHNKDVQGNETAASATVGAHMDDQGNMTSMSFGGSFSRNGKTVSAGAGYDLHVTEPRKQGDVWVVDWLRTFNVHGGGNVGKIGGSVNHDDRRFGSRSFPTEAAAKAFYDQAESNAASLVIDPTSVDDATQLAIGETRGTGDSTVGSANISIPVTAGGFSVSGDKGDSSAVQVKRVSKTVFDLTRSASSMSGHGFGASTIGGIGASKKNFSESGGAITVEVDISTPQGKVAYESFARTGAILPGAKEVAETVSESEGTSTTSTIPGAQTTWAGHTEHSVTKDQQGTTEQFAGETSQVASSHVPLLGGETDDTGVRFEAGEVNKQQSFYALTGHVSATEGEASSKDLARITGMVRDNDAQGDVKSSGAWQVQVEVTPELVDQFVSKVSDEQIRDMGIFDSDDPRNDLRQAIQSANTSADKKKALADYFAHAGFDGKAISAMRHTLWGVKNEMAMTGSYEQAVQNETGNFDYDLTLPGDKNFTGTAGRLELEGKIDTYTKAVADADPKSLDTLHNAIYKTLGEIREQRGDINDPQRYTDLPRQLRETQVARLDRYIAQLSELASQAGLAFTQADAATAQTQAAGDAAGAKHPHAGKTPPKDAGAAPTDPALKALASLRGQIGAADVAVQKAKADYRFEEDDYNRRYLQMADVRGRVPDNEFDAAFKDGTQAFREATALKATAAAQDAGTDELRSQFIAALAQPDSAQAIGSSTLSQLKMAECLWSPAVAKVTDASNILIGVTAQVFD